MVFSSEGLDELSKDSDIDFGKTDFRTELNLFIEHPLYTHHCLGFGKGTN